MDKQSFFEWKMNKHRNKKLITDKFYNKVSSGNVDLDEVKDNDLNLTTKMIVRLKEWESALQLQHISEWDDEYGYGIWWRKDNVVDGIPREEPSYIGSPTNFPRQAQYEYFILIPEVIRLEGIE